MNDLITPLMMGDISRSLREVNTYTLTKDPEHPQDYLNDKQRFTSLFFKIQAENAMSSVLYTVMKTDNNEKVEVKTTRGVFFDVNAIIDTLYAIMHEAVTKKKATCTLWCSNNMNRFLFNSRGFKVDISKRLYKQAFKPIWPVLAKAVGATFYSEKINGERMLVFQLAAKVAYFVPSQPLLEQPKLLDASFKKMREASICCDTVFVSKEGGSLSLHSAILFLRGGDVFQRMLRGDFKEKKEKVIELKKYSEPVLRAVIDFLYEESSQAFIDSFSQVPVCDHFELYQFAEMYQMTGLIECVARIIALKQSKNDIETIRDLSERYDNETLKELYQHLQQKYTIVEVSAEKELEKSLESDELPPL